MLALLYKPTRQCRHDGTLLLHMSHTGCTRDP